MIDMTLEEDDTEFALFGYNAKYRRRFNETKKSLCDVFCGGGCSRPMESCIMADFNPVQMKDFTLRHFFNLP